VTELVVDVFETIDIKHHQRQGTAVPTRSRYFLLEQLREDAR